jgi:hypothetical protein
MLALAAIGAFPLSVSAAEPPANTAFATAGVIRGNTGALNTRLADVVPDPASPEALPELWWKWTADRSGRVSLDTLPQTPRPVALATTKLAAWPEPTYDVPDGWPAGEVVLFRSGKQWNGGFSGGTTISTFRPPPAPLTLTVFAGDSADTLVEKARFTFPRLPSVISGKPDAYSFFAEEGANYSFRVAEEAGASGISSLSFLFTPTPANDQFADRLPLSGVEASAVGSTYAASLKNGQPLAGPGAVNRAVWWTWTPPVAGNLSLMLNATNMVLGAFRGNSLENLELIGSTGSDLAVAARPGEPIQFAVDSLGNDGGFDYTLLLRLDPLPPTLDARQSRRLGDGSFQLRAEQLRGREVVLFASPDLFSWMTVWRGTVNGDGVTFRDLDATNSAQVFYSIRLTPPAAQTP